MCTVVSSAPSSSRACSVDSSCDLLPPARALLQGKQLLWLSRLQLEVEIMGWRVGRDEVTPWCVDVPDVSRVAACLPALNTLSLLHVARDHATVAQLTQLLSGLMSLSVAGTAFDDGAAPHVTLLTSLVELKWCDSKSTFRGLQRLTALTRLTLIVFDSIDADEPVLSEGLCWLELVSSKEVGGVGGGPSAPWRAYTCAPGAFAFVPCLLLLRPC